MISNFLRVITCLVLAKPHFEIFHTDSVRLPLLSHECGTVNCLDRGRSKVYSSLAMTPSSLPNLNRFGPGLAATKGPLQNPASPGKLGPGRQFWLTVVYLLAGLLSSQLACYLLRVGRMLGTFCTNDPRLRVSVRRRNLRFNVDLPNLLPRGQA